MVFSYIVSHLKGSSLWTWCPLSCNVLFLSYVFTVSLEFLVIGEELNKVLWEYGSFTDFTEERKVLSWWKYMYSSVHLRVLFFCILLFLYVYLMLFSIKVPDYGAFCTLALMKSTRSVQRFPHLLIQ